MQPTLISNVSIFDGTGAPPFPGQVLIEGNRVKAVARGGEQRIAGAGAAVVDGEGATLMPGLVDAHTHLGFGSAVDRVLRGRPRSAAAMLLITAHTAKVMLDHGFTSAYSAGAHDAAAETALRDEIAAGWLPGPRLRACSFERDASNANTPGRRYLGVDQRPPDIGGVRTFVAEMAAVGVDSVKFVVTGDNSIVPNTSLLLLYHDEELAAAAAAAREAGLWLNAHAHSAAAIKLVLKNGFRVIYHCTWPDEEALDMLEAQKHEIFVAPTVGLNWTNIHADPAYAKRDNGAALLEQTAKLDHLRELLPVLRRRGIRLLPGGDYGFPTNPIGRNAHDLTLFVELFGFAPAEALSAATKLGGEIMGMGDELGLIRPGYLADLLLLDGDPLRDITLLENPERLLMIMKDGKYHKPPPRHRQRKAAAA